MGTHFSNPKSTRKQGPVPKYTVHIVFELRKFEEYSG